LAIVAVRLRALVLALVAILPIAAGTSRVALALRGPERHVCVCPIDADGHCECPECIRLHIHAPIGAEHRDHDDHDRPSGPVIASACESAPHLVPAPPPVDPALVPIALDPPPVSSIALVLARALARAPASRSAAPAVPPPRRA